MQQELTNKTGDFAKKSVAVQKGSIQENIAKANLSDANVVSLAQPGEAINELKSGQVEGVVLEKAIAQGYVDQNSDLAVSDIALKSDSKDAYAVAMPKGSDKLKAKVNKVIAKTQKSKVRLTAMFKMPMLSLLRVLLNKGLLYEEILVYPYSSSRYLLSSCL